MEYMDFFKHNSILQLPRCINDIIFDYLIPKNIIFQFKINLGTYYPFHPPKITPEYQNHFLGLCVGEEQYKQTKKTCEELVNDSICMLDLNDWSPANTISKMILSFIANIDLDERY